LHDSGREFTLPSGETSQLGIQLADAFSKELAAQQNAIHIIERSRLRDYLEQECISEKLLSNEKAMRWLGKQLGATVVLTGVTTDKGESVRIQVKLRSNDKEKSGPMETLTLSYAGSKDDLSPMAPNPKAASAGNVSAIPGVFRAGMGGVGAPACLHCPDPSYTDPARAAKFTGTVLLDVVVSADGEAKSATIIQGAPFGLNENAMDTIRQWKFKPATRNGQPVPVMVMIEVTFRLY
jgi:TonB family protein